MKLFIDNKEIDIVLEKEKTLGDLFCGIENWLSSAMLCISYVEIDGDTSCTSNMTKLFQYDIANVKTVNIHTALVPELHLEALNNAINIINEFSAADEKRKSEIRQEWGAISGAAFLKEHDTEIYNIIIAAINGNYNIDNVKQELTIRFNEVECILKTPDLEFVKLDKALPDIIKSLESLPVNLQTGRDKESSNTIFIFTKFVDKMFYLINILFIGLKENENLNITGTLREFTGVLKEFLSAYENKDIVLCGDLSEYEISPRLQDIFKNINLLLSKREDA
ncbi:MAG: hypothetical protein Ta2F_17150 [Termitinemataceae bacterium]|nr:MAG: hypothetical protein Ta2F_17150 [Termitinemataceae bacterium]